MAIFTHNYGVIGGAAKDAGNAGVEAGNGSYRDEFQFVLTPITGADNDFVYQLFTIPENQIWLIHEAEIYSSDNVDTVYAYTYPPGNKRTFTISAAITDPPNANQATRQQNNDYPIALLFNTTQGVHYHDDAAWYSWLIPAGCTVELRTRINNAAGWAGESVRWTLSVYRFFFDANRPAPILPYQIPGGRGVWPPAAQQ